MIHWDQLADELAIPGLAEEFAEKTPEEKRMILEVILEEYDRSKDENDGHT